jgi:hypothetical protein
MTDYMTDFENWRDSLYDLPQPEAAFPDEPSLDYRRWLPVEADKQNWLYSGRSEADLERGCIGHLRGDFEKGTGELWTTWFDHLDQLKTSEFRDDLQDTILDRRRQLRLPDGKQPV